jgi:chitinase
MTEDTEYENNLEKWNPNKTYYADSTITYNGKVYEAKWWTKGDIPNEKVANPWETPWKLIK